MEERGEKEEGKEKASTNSLRRDTRSLLQGLGHASSHTILIKPRPLGSVTAQLHGVQHQVTCQAHHGLGIEKKAEDRAELTCTEPHTKTFISDRSRGLFHKAFI
jgi:hypothetical protein